MPNRFRIVLLAGIWLIAVGCASLQPDPNSRQADREANNPEQTPTPPVTSRAKDADSNQNQSDNLWQFLAERLVDPVTWFTGMLVWLSWRQWRAMKLQGDYMRDGLAITKQAADAARLSAETAEQALHLTQRAFLVIKQWEVKDWTIGAKPRLVCAIMNTGHTPAKNVLVEGNFEIRTLPLPDIPEWPGHKDSGPGHAIGPGGIKVSVLEGDDILTPETMLQLEQGIRTGCMHGVE